MEEPKTMFVMYAIYERPRDYPDHYVTRRWTMDLRSKRKESIPSPIACLASSLEEARRQIPPVLNGMRAANIGRQPTEDPAIVETWI